MEECPFLLLSFSPGWVGKVVSDSAPRGTLLKIGSERGIIPVHEFIVYTIFPSLNIVIMPPLCETTIPIDFVNRVIPAIDECREPNPSGMSTWPISTVIYLPAASTVPFPIR